MPSGYEKSSDYNFPNGPDFWTWIAMVAVFVAIMGS